MMNYFKIVSNRSGFVTIVFTRQVNAQEKSKAISLVTKHYGKPVSSLIGA